MTLPKLSNTVCAGLTGSALLLTSACGISLSSGVPYCDQNPGICAAIGFLIIGGIIAAQGGGSGSSDSGYGDTAVVSDTRLKTDVTYLETLDNGLRLYAFRYHGQKDGFVGVIADDLLQDPRFAHAVHRGEDGYLRVDYTRLGVQLSNMQAMISAGNTVLGLPS